MRAVKSTCPAYLLKGTRYIFRSTDKSDALIRALVSACHVLSFLIGVPTAVVPVVTVVRTKKQS